MNVAPFPALRYSVEVGERARVVSLPYDQFDEEGREARYRQDPHHVVRLIRPPAHRQARATLEAWLAEGILSPDSAPSFYPLRQRFAPPGGDGLRDRWALIALVELSPLDQGPVRPHERTFPDTVEERRGLRQAVGADVGLVLMLYDDPGGSIDDRVQRAAEAEPVTTAEDESGTRNSLWRWSNPAQLEPLSEALRSSGAIIADGHHRYTAAWRHWQGRGADPADPARWIMVALVSQEAAGLTILPIHRLLKRTVDPDTLLQSGAEGFAVEPLLAEGDSEAAVAAARSALERHSDEHAFAVVIRSGAGLRADLFRSPAGSFKTAVWPESVPAVWRSLDVTVLQARILGSLLGRALQDQREDSGELAFTNDDADAVAAVAGGERGTAFLINPLRLADVRRVVEAGHLLPQKSTNFYPKAVSGLTFYRFEGDSL